MASGEDTNIMADQGGNEQLELQKRVSELLEDAEARDLMIQRLREGGHVAGDPPNAGVTTFAVPSTSFTLPSTSTSGASNSPWPMLPFPFATMPFPQFWGPSATVPTSVAQSLPGSASSLGQPGSASSLGQGTEGEEEDVVALLDDEEATEFPNFDPTVPDDSAWDAGEAITAYLERNFTREMSDKERNKILQDFPKPSCKVLIAPKLDEEVKTQIKKTGKDPHFGAERSLYTLQQQLLELAGPLTCLWADMADQEANVDRQAVILLVQRVLCLLGSTSHSITQERRKVAWSRINPSTVGLLQEEKEKDSTLFGGGFLERAAKRMEDEKAIAKVTGGASNYKKRPQDPNDLRRFFGEGRPRKVRRRETTAPPAVPPAESQPQVHQGKGKEMEQVTPSLNTVCIQTQCFLNMLLPLSHLPISRLRAGSHFVSRLGRL